MDLEEASKWYAMAADNGNIEARDHLMLIDIRQNGYEEARHAEWLTQLREKASDSMDAKSMLQKLRKQVPGS